MNPEEQRKFWWVFSEIRNPLLDPLLFRFCSAADELSHISVFMWWD